MNKERSDYPVRAENRYGPEFRFTSPDTILFLTGVPLSGKSAIAPFISSSIEGCAQQSMDIVRLFAKKLDSLKPANERDPFLTFGSCDSYLFVGDGSYSQGSLIEGFNQYSKAVFLALKAIMPGLETQGESNMLFEGVQLNPSIVSPYLLGNNRLIIVTSNEDQLRKNREKMHGLNEEMVERYSLDKLLILQDEILRQAKSLDPGRLIVIENLQDISGAVAETLSALVGKNTLQAI